MHGRYLSNGGFSWPIGSRNFVKRFYDPLANSCDPFLLWGFFLQEAKDGRLMRLILMHRSQLEHGIRAAKAITDENEFFVFGTASILAEYPNLDESVVYSNECDLWPKKNPAKADILECIGELSPFHTTHGFYLDPKSPEEVILPKGWEKRVIRISNENTAGGVALCIEKHDLVTAKMARGDKKDLIFVAELLRRRLIQRETILERTKRVDPNQRHYQQDDESPLVDIRSRILKNFEKALHLSQSGRVAESPPEMKKSISKKRKT